jgi:hypothetical protein
MPLANGKLHKEYQITLFITPIFVNPVKPSLESEFELRQKPSSILVKRWSATLSEIDGKIDEF